jgi:hypothetical protein
LNILTIFQVIAALATTATGLLAFVRPEATFGFIGLNPNGVRGISEIRAVFGGLFIGLGLSPFLLGRPANQMLGYGYLAIAITRAFSILFDKSYAQSNIISLVIEIVFGVLLVM